MHELTQTKTALSPYQCSVSSSAQLSHGNKRVELVARRARLRVHVGVSVRHQRIHGTTLYTPTHTPTQHQQHTNAHLRRLHLQWLLRDEVGGASPHTPACARVLAWAYHVLHTATTLHT
jgi:hypothetical protein